MILCDTGPIVSAVNRGEGRRHLFAADLLSRLGRRVVVPWPVYAEVDLLLRSRGHVGAALAFGSAVLEGVHLLVAPSNAELAVALAMGRRYAESGADLPDLTVMAMAESRDALVLTWDYRHFRSLVPAKGGHWPLLVSESELPDP